MSFFALSEREHFGRLDADDRARIATATPVATTRPAGMTAPQGIAAILLALAFGHGWATSIAYREFAGRRGVPGEWEAFCASPEFRKTVASHRGNLDYAYDLNQADAPDHDMGLRSSTEHTTGSRTLSWSVTPDGTVKIIVRAGPSSIQVAEWNWKQIPMTVIATVTVAPNGETQWSHITTSPLKGKIAGRDSSRVNAADGQPLPGSDEYAYEVAARAVRAIGGRVESQPMTRRLPRGRRALDSIA